MALEWKGAPGNVIATGAKGIYTIQTVGSSYILQGIDNDGKSMVDALGFLGISFGGLDNAKHYAAELDGAA